MLDDKLCNWVMEPAVGKAPAKICALPRAHLGHHDSKEAVTIQQSFEDKFKELANHILNERAIYYKEVERLRDYAKGLERRIAALEAKPAFSLPEPAALEPTNGHS